MFRGSLKLLYRTCCWTSRKCIKCFYNCRIIGNWKRNGLLSLSLYQTKRTLEMNFCSIKRNRNSPTSKMNRNVFLEWNLFMMMMKCNHCRQHESGLYSQPEDHFIEPYSLSLEIVLPSASAYVASGTSQWEQKLSLKKNTSLVKFTLGKIYYLSALGSCHICIQF